RNMENREIGENLAQKASSVFAIDIHDKESSVQLQNFQKDIIGFLEEFRQAFIANSGEDGDFAGALKSLENIRDILEFSRQISAAKDSNKEYMQFPYFAENRENLAELHVFRKKRQSKEGKSSQNSKKTQTALIALDLANLGKIETLVNLQGKSVGLQFRAVSNKTLGIIGAHASKLTELLNASGYNISNLAFKRIDEGFDIAVNLENTIPEQKRAETAIRRYSFDIRV
ncbi:MAG: flagellar hook-length control protein FliK, partial [Defluviitaleaceae bacterium]|nr:flagellar hook-length control protein FliK [Defluviitaleaceae bacterium]